MSSKATVVSLIPKKIEEFKPGMTPSFYKIAPAPKDGISILVVEDGFHMVPMALTDPPKSIKMIDTSDTIARGLVEDYHSALIGVSYEDPEAIAAPGLFYIDGEHTVEQIY